ncbi:MAG: hypothetical protein J5601_01450, partial [Elusimicrobiaceae bacterium]|nr:hypothetical protein [Elusimicrobiaceae bacterium]
QEEKGNPLKVIQYDGTGEDIFLVGHNTSTGNDMIYRFIQEYAACFELKMVVPSEMQISDEEEYDKTYYRAIFDTPKKTITNNIVKGKNRFWLEEDPTQERILRSSEDPRILALFMREFQLEETNEDKEHYENFYAHSPEMNIRISKWKMYDCGFRPDQALQEQEEKGNPLKVIQYDGTGEDIFLVGHNTSTGNDMIYRFIQDSDSCIELALTVSPETQIPVSTSYQAVRNTPKKTITKNVVKGNNRFGDETY